MYDEIAVEFDTYKDLCNLLSMIDNFKKRKEITKADMIYIEDFISKLTKELKKDLISKKVCPDCGEDLTKEYIPEDEQIDAIFRLRCENCDFSKEVYR